MTCPHPHRRILSVRSPAPPEPAPGEPRFVDQARVDWRCLGCGATGTARSWSEFDGIQGR